MRARRYRHRPSGRQRRAALHLHGAGARPRYMHRGQGHSAHVSDRRLRNEQLYRNDAPQLPQTASKSAVRALHHSARPSAASGLAHLRAAPLVAAAEAVWSGPCLELGSVAIAISVIRKSLVTPRLSCVSTLFDCPSPRPPARPAARVHPNCCPSACVLTLPPPPPPQRVGCSPYLHPSPHPQAHHHHHCSPPAAPCYHGCCLSEPLPQSPPRGPVVCETFGQSRPSLTPASP
jgi:hypothetical protein